VLIPNIFQIYNESTMYSDPAMGRFRYQGPMGPKPEEKADQCAECGECEEKCPQKVTVIEWLKKAHETLSAPTQPPR
jgi:predicted aldo/keto reductase-like oxidoreductase